MSPFLTNPSFKINPFEFFPLKFCLITFRAEQSITNQLGFPFSSSSSLHFNLQLQLSEPSPASEKQKRRSLSDEFGSFGLDITKTGSLCCVAARPHGSSSTDDPNEPYWQTNSSFSPPPPNSGWGFGFSPEELLPCDSSDHNLVHRSSVKETGRMIGNPFYSRRNITSDVGEGFLSSFDEFEAATSRGVLEKNRSTRTSSASSSSSSTDFADVFETFEPENIACPSDGFRCGICERFLSHRSPYSSRRIMMTGTMPPSAVLWCRHVYHSECLDQTTPNSHSSDPPCPLCSRSFPKLSRPLLEDTQSRSRVCVPQCNTMLVLNRTRLRKNLALKGNSIKGFPGNVARNGPSSSQVSKGCSWDPSMNL